MGKRSKKNKSRQGAEAKAGQVSIDQAVTQTPARLGLVRPAKSPSRQDKDSVYKRVMDSLDQNFFAMRDWNLAKTLYWAGKKD
jgi:hypothetical protein